MLLTWLFIIFSIYIYISLFLWWTPFCVYVIAPFLYYFLAAEVWRWECGVWGG